MCFQVGDPKGFRDTQELGAQPAYGRPLPRSYRVPAKVYATQGTVPSQRDSQLGQSQLSHVVPREIQRHQGQRRFAQLAQGGTLAHLLCEELANSCAAAISDHVVRQLQPLERRRRLRHRPGEKIERGQLKE